MSPDMLVLVLAGVGLIAVVAYWVARPLWRGEVPVDPPDPRAVALLAERESTLAALRDLDADHADGRLGDADYEALRADTVARGAATLAALDQVAADAAGRTAALAAEIEAEVAAAREGAPVVASEATPRGGIAPQARYCTACGREADPGDRFCAACGRPLSRSDPETPRS